MLAQLQVDPKAQQLFKDLLLQKMSYLIFHVTENGKDVR